MWLLYKEEHLLMFQGKAILRCTASNVVDFHTPLEIFAMNIPTNGDQAIHHPQ